MKHCLYCLNEIPNNENGNRLYCHHACYYAAKLERQKDTRKNIAEFRNRMQESEFILQRLCQIHGTRIPFDPMEAEEMGFDFGVADGVVSHEGKRGIRIGAFVYMLVNPKHMIIWTI